MKNNLVATLEVAIYLQFYLYHGILWLNFNMTKNTSGLSVLNYTSIIMEVKMKKWIVALVIEDGTKVLYDCYEVIEAQSNEEAIKKYNEKHKCNFFSATCVGEIDEETGTVNVSVKHFIRDYKKE